MMVNSRSISMTAMHDGENTLHLTRLKFLIRFSYINNLLCQVFVVTAKKELVSMDV